MPKAEKIQDYERTIEEMTKQQVTWYVAFAPKAPYRIHRLFTFICRDDSPEMREFLEKKMHMDEIESNCVNLEQLVQSLEAANQHLDGLNMQENPRH